MCPRHARIISAYSGIHPVVSVYGFDEDPGDGLRVLRFGSADGDWLDFVTGNRKGSVTDGDYDILVGPMADERARCIILLYKDGVLDRE